MATDKTALPPIPAKRYFAIGEVAELCVVKPHVLRYWEQEFSQIRPMKRRGNRRYYQHHEVLMIRRIRELLYDQGFTISGARNFLSNQPPPPISPELPDTEMPSSEMPTPTTPASEQLQISSLSADWLRHELQSIQRILNAKA